MAKNRWPGVYQRGKVWAWRAQFEEDGERWGESKSGYPTAKAAWEARNEALRKAKGRGRLKVSDGNVTLAAWLETWLRDHERTVRPGTASAYRSRIERIKAHPLASKRLRSLTEGQYRRLIADLAEGRRHSTVMGKVATLSSALNAAVKVGLITDNPIPRIHVARNESRFEVEPWDAETARKFLAHRKAAHDPLHHVWHLAIVTGMRRGELHGLRWDDIDLDAGIIWIRRQRTEVRSEMLELAPKTEGSEAPVFLDPGTVELLRSVPRTHEYVLVAPHTGRPYGNMSTFLKHWAKATDDAGVPPIRFHDLRHTSASLMAAAGVPLLAAQQRLRHWSPAMTRRYTHATNTLAQDTAARIGEVLSPVNEEPGTAA